jgi:PH and SEC7 domain-containing protein
LKRDPKVKDHVRKYLAANSSNHHNNHHHYQELSNSHIPAPSSPIININTNNINYQRGHRISSSDSSAACRKTSRIPVNNSRIPSLSAPQSPQAIKPRYQSHIPTANGSLPTVASQKKQQHTPPRFEAYMMTGDLILNLSRTPQSSGLLPASAQVKKSTVESLRDSPARSLKRKNGTAPRANYDSSPSESSSHSISELPSYESAGDHHNLHHRNNYSNSSDNESRRASKLSKMHLAANSDSLDEEEEQLIMETTHDDDDESPSAGVKDERKTKKYNLSNIGCANNTSSSSSASSPTNTNSSNSSDNHHHHHHQKEQQQSNNNSNSGSYDGGGVANNNSSKKQTDQVGGNSGYGHERNQKYSMLNNEDGGQGQSQQQQQHHQNLPASQQHLEVRNVTSSASMSSTTTTSSASTTINRSETLLTPTLDVSHSMPASPTSYSTPLLEASGKRRELNSVPNSPESGNQQQDALAVRRNSSNTHFQQNGVTAYRKCEGVSSFRTSRSEDHLQHSQREGAMGNAIPIDIDEDINSSLNTLLDTRHDSEDSQVSFFVCANL